MSKMKTAAAVLIALASAWCVADVIDRAAAAGQSSAAVAAPATPTTKAAPLLELHLRRQEETEPGSGRFNAKIERATWDPKKTAIIVCDMWNRHWCRGATARVGEMAPRMNAVLVAARKQGVLILHCPSETMKTYEGTAQRELARRAVAVARQTPLKPPTARGVQHEGPLPIVDSDGGCDCDPPCKIQSPFTREIETLKIEAADAITDNEEALTLMSQKGIENVIVMGVHTNMCVLGRPFGIRQLVRNGLNVALMRDLTDTMYNSRQAPQVSHFTGTDLVVAHIERNWCPSITSVDLVGGREFRFSDDHRPTALIVTAEPEYETDRTLPEFAARELGKDFRVNMVFGGRKGAGPLPGFDSIRDADVVLISVRRRPLPPEQMRALREYVANGGGIVGIRTASHAFSPAKKSEASAAASTWESWDPEVLGGHYVGHHGKADKTKISPAADASEHPVMKGVDIKSLVGNGSLYRVSPLAPSAHPLLIGSIPDKQPEPVAWTFRRADGGRSFYTSLGHPNDFSNPAFRAMLVNALRWAAAH